MSPAADTTLSIKFQMEYIFRTNLKCLGANFEIKIVKPSQSLEEKLQYEMSNYIQVPLPGLPEKTHQICTNPMTKPKQGWGSRPLADDDASFMPRFSRFIYHCDQYFHLESNTRTYTYILTQNFGRSSFSTATTPRNFDALEIFTDEKSTI